jgi:WD40 repeat protein
MLVAVWRDEDDGGSLHLVDARTGADLPGHQPIFLGGIYWHALSPDGRTLAVVSLPERDSPAGGSLRLIDIDAWSQRATDVKIDSWPTSLVFSPDGGRVAIGASSDQDHLLALFDRSTWRATVASSLDFDLLETAFTPDGRSLLVYGARYAGAPGLNPVLVAAQIDTADLQIEWEMELSGVKDGQYAASGLSDQELHDTSIWWRPAVILAPGTEQLIIVHADSERLTTIDFAQRSQTTVAIRRSVSWLERLVGFGSFPALAKELNGTSKSAVLSADGRQLVVVGRTVRSSLDGRGNMTVEEASLGIEIVDLETGELLAMAETRAGEIVMAPDDQHVLVGGWSNTPWIDVMDVEDLGVSAELRMLDPDSLEAVDGSSMMAASYSRPDGTTRVALLDTSSWRVIDEWAMPGYLEVWDAGGPPAD